MSWARPAPRVKQYEGIAPDAPRKPLRRVPAAITLVVPLSKAVVVRNRAYRMLVAALPCIHCGIEGHSQAAHGPSLGKGLKASDRELFPLCTVSGNDCHGKFDRYELMNRWDREIAGAMWAARTRLKLGVE